MTTSNVTLARLTIQKINKKKQNNKTDLDQTDMCEKISKETQNETEKHSALKNSIYIQFKREKMKW